MTPLTKRAVEIFAPTTGGGAPRGANMGEAQTWGTEIETGLDYAYGLSADTTWYVHPNGSDLNDGLASTPERAFATIGKALEVVGEVRANGFSVRIQLVVVNGMPTTHYRDEGTTLPNVFGAKTGNDECVIRGDPANPANIIVRQRATGEATFEGSRTLSTNWTLDGLSIECDHASGIYTDTGANKVTLRNMRYGPCAAAQIYCGGDIILASGSYTHSVYGSAQSFVRCQIGIIRMGGVTLTFESSVSYSNAFILTNYSNTIVRAESMTFSLGAFTVTGRRFEGRRNSHIDPGTDNVDYFPGDTAGRIDQSSVYGSTPGPINLAWKTSFSAFRSSNHTNIQDSTPTALNMNTERWDDGSDHASGVVTPKIGKTRLTGKVVVGSGVVAGSLYKLMLYQNTGSGMAYYETLDERRASYSDTLLLSGTVTVNSTNGTDSYQLYFEGGGSGVKMLLGGTGVSLFEGTPAVHVL